MSGFTWVPPILRVGECKMSPFSIAGSSELIHSTRASCIASTHMQKLAISTSNSLQNDAVEAFPIHILVWIFFGRPDWNIGPIKCTYDPKEMANVLKFLYGLPSFRLGLGKFD